MAKPVFKSVLANAAGDDWQAAPGSSSPVDCTELTDITVILFGTFVATVFVDISMDNVTWAAWESRTTPGAFTKIPACKSFKMRTSAWTSGTPSAACSGLRSDV